MSEYSFLSFGKMIQKNDSDRIFVVKWENNESGNDPPTFFFFKNANELWQKILSNPQYENLVLVEEGEDQTNYQKPNLKFDDEVGVFSILHSCSDNYDMYKPFSQYNNIKTALNQK